MDNRRYLGDEQEAVEPFLCDLMERRRSLAITAHHEAAHAVVNYRACPDAGAGDISIVPDHTRGLLGANDDAASDSFKPDHMEARILSCYADGHAQRRLDPRTGADGCDSDDAIAADLLFKFQWESREQKLRDRAGEMVNEHWGEIVAVAVELLQTQRLDTSEVELIADAIAGDPDADLARYRLLRDWPGGR